MKRTLVAFALIFGIAAAPAAFAQQFKINEEQARKFAADRGIVRITEIERDDGKWKIEGRDAQGREIEIDIHGQTGEVVKFERD
jgi:uncharacterized membrane protein YkoI